MKKCPKCNEGFPDIADTCPRCYIDLDTGEMLEIRKDIDLDKLSKHYSSAVRYNIISRISWVSLIVSFILSSLLVQVFEVLPFNWTVKTLNTISIMTFITWITFTILTGINVEKVKRLLGDKAPQWVRAFWSPDSHKYLREARDILKHNNKLIEEKWSIFNKG